MQDEYSSKKQEEETLRLKAAEICRLDFDDKTYSEEWLQNRSFEIAELKEEKMVNLNELNKELWENNIDLTLNNNDYWIANNDIDTIKLRIEDAGVRVSYGTQFLSILSQDDRKKYLKDYPMLPFSLVIADEEDWKITKNNMPKDILLRNMVSIFIRTEMNGVLPAGYRFIDHKGAEFTENAAVFRQWKEMAEQLEQLINKNLDELKKISSKWQNYKIDNISTDTADMEIDNADKKLKEKEMETQDVMKNIGETAGILKIAVQRIEEESKKILDEHHKTPEKWEDINLDEKTFRIKNDIADNDKYIDQADKILYELSKRNELADESISPLKYNKELDVSKGKTSEDIMNKVNGNEKNEVEAWQKNYNSAEENIRR